VAIAQTPGKVYRLALVSPGGLLPESAPYAKLLLGGLAKLGYTPGISRRLGSGSVEPYFQFIIDCVIRISGN
jgi:hypothetical protein